MKQESDLVKGLRGVAIFSSPEHKRNVSISSRESLDDGYVYYHKYDAPVDESLFDWLEQNSLVKIKDKISGRNHYLFMGSNGTLCSVSPSVQKNDYHDLIQTRVEKYHISAEVNYQPADAELPSELTDAFREFGLERKK